MLCLGKTDSDRIWRKGTKKVSCSHLAVYISRCRASCCAEQPPVLMGGSVPRCRVRKNGCCIGRKQESIIESWAWTYISCNWRSINFVFRQIIYRRERRAATRPGGSKFFLFSFSTAVTKTGPGWLNHLPVWQQGFNPFDVSSSDWFRMVIMW